jgi:hypothetical protein
VTDERLTDELAVRVMGWRLAPGRYIKTRRSWIPRWRFRPLTSLDDAFQLLDRAADRHMHTRDSDHRFAADVRMVGRTGKASEEGKARGITFAVARALQLDAEVTS